ncbi:type II secretion system protein GspG [Azovibrio restrictus]|uniref:type II secretion system protein GspG n=1 Tax=Azovibrio restrictus TaxID=146938 RepID=UPI0026F1BF45|nr:type II secretion system protein GspG [Azovibrio restrictus]MDD3481408.1 type II secretion system protein GspG [Azovibrio restrictus]
MNDRRLNHNLTRRLPSLAETLALGLPLITALAATLWLAQGLPDARELAYSQARDDLRALRSALLLPALERPQLPDTDQGLETLVREGSLKQLPLDPWGRPYQYRYPGQAHTYELFSLGPDGVESQDDVVAWNLYGGR